MRYQTRRRTPLRSVCATYTGRSSSTDATPHRPTLQPCICPVQQHPQLAQPPRRSTIIPQKPLFRTPSALEEVRLFLPKGDEVWWIKWGCRTALNQSTCVYYCVDIPAYRLTCPRVQWKTIGKANNPFLYMSTAIGKKTTLFFTCQQSHR